ncbi:MAG: ABC transporter permease [Candidatus Magasanikbacteria bacterium]|nr:ABC transporter permease [Candidatus Magasanikbacteria bacterium]
MLAIDVLRLSTRMFRVSKSRTFLTILGISVGIGAILFLVSLGYGLQKMILEQITTSDALLSLDISTGDLENLKLNEVTVKDIANIPSVNKLSSLVVAQAQLNIEDISSELTVNFANRDYFGLEGTKLKLGNFYSDEEKDSHKIIISSVALQLFGLSEEDIFSKKIKLTLFPPQEEGENQEIIVRDSILLDGDFEVIGIIEEESSSYIYVPFSVSNAMGKVNYSKVKVRVDTEDSLNTVRDAIIAKGYVVSALSDIIDQANQIFNFIQIVLASFGIVALIVSAIGMFNTMTITLLERTQEIGIMKALGATAGDIWVMFLTEALVIGFLGGFMGLVIGLAGGETFNFILNRLAGALGGQMIDIFYTPTWFAVTILVFSTFVGFATGFYPSRRAAKINVLDALRYN